VGKKTGSTGRFGARYGRRIRMFVKKVEEKQRKTYKCPSCRMVSLRRFTAGIWKCKKCGAKFAGGAYVPDTSVKRGS